MPTREHAITRTRNQDEKIAAVLIMLAAPCAAQTTVPGALQFVPIGTVSAFGAPPSPVARGRPNARPALFLIAIAKTPTR
jgi:hypothetical protein